MRTSLSDIYKDLPWQPQKEMAPHSSTFAWKIPWKEEPGRLRSIGSLESDTTEQLHFHFSLSCIGEGNGNPLQCSCLENPRDGGAWWAAIYGVPQSWTRLKRLSSSSSSSHGNREESMTSLLIWAWQGYSPSSWHTLEIFLSTDLTWPTCADLGTLLGSSHKSLRTLNLK